MMVAMVVLVVVAIALCFGNGCVHCVGGSYYGSDFGCDVAMVVVVDVVVRHDGGVQGGYGHDGDVW